jgi:hypothetical protein
MPAPPPTRYGGANLPVQAKTPVMPDRRPVAPPPTRYGGANRPVQAKASMVASGRAVAPPSTRYGGANLPVQAKASMAASGRAVAPPPTRYGGANRPVQAKVFAGAPPPIEFGSPTPIQRNMTGWLQPHTPAPLSQEANARLVSVMTTLSTVLTNDPNINIRHLIVSVEQVGGADYQGGQSTISGDNPAQTRTLPNAGGNPDIRITVQRPFAEKASEGEMLGMLAHEIGVHNIPSDLRGINDFGALNFAPIVTPRKTAEGNTPSGGYEFQNWPGAPLGAARPPNRDQARQHDHVMVADILRNPPVAGGVMPLTRANVYFQTVLDIGDAVWNNINLTQAERQTQTEELIHLYLVDIARIIATDDGRINPVGHGLALLDVYHDVFNQVVLPHRPQHVWIPQAPSIGNRFTLYLSLGAFIGKVKLNKWFT